MNTIADVLQTKGNAVYTISPGATVQDAVVEMCRVKVGALLVLAPDGTLAGILSERDLLIRVLLCRKDPASTKVRDVMTVGVVCVEHDETVATAMAIMTRSRCRHLPVVDPDGEIAGLVSIGDLVRDVGRDQQLELRVMHEYVEGKYPG